MHERYTAIIRLAKKAVQQHMTIKEATEVMRATMIVLALEAWGGNRAQAAQALGLQRGTMNAEIRRLLARGVLEEEDTDYEIIDAFG